MEQTRELSFTPAPKEVEIPSVAKLREMFLVGGKIKYDADGNPSNHDLKVEASLEQLEKFLGTQKDIFPKGGPSDLSVKSVDIKGHKGTVSDPWNGLSYEFNFTASRTEEQGKVWTLVYRVVGGSDSMKVIPQEFDFVPSF